MKTKKLQPVVYPFVQSTPFGKVKIYRNAEGDRTRYIVAWVDAEEGRKRETFAEELQAHQRAEELIEDLNKGVSFRNNINATKALRIAEYEALLAKHGKTLGDAVRFYLLDLEKKVENRAMASDAVAQYMDKFETKTGRHYETVKYVLKKFARSFNKTLCSITADELDTYFREISASGRTRNNHLGCVKTFFKWAQERKGYLAEGKMQIDKLEPYNEVTSKIEVFTPEEIAKLLKAAGDKLRPYLAIGAFAGVRSAEINRLNWEDIDFDTKMIKLSSEITKTKRRRLATMPDNLVLWLNTYSGEKSGPIVAVPTRLHKDMAELCKTAGVAWKGNALRKSYISYRMAQPDVTSYQVAKQCGNSSAMVEEHYKELVSPKVADAWFSVTPTTL
jgi:integrase